MIPKATMWRGGVALCLAAGLMIASTGCPQSAKPPPSSSPSKNKPADQKPDDKPKQPPPDVG
jgi:hypothetical protein